MSTKQAKYTPNEAGSLFSNRLASDDMFFVSLEVDAARPGFNKDLEPYTPDFPTNRLTQG